MHNGVEQRLERPQAVDFRGGREIDRERARGLHDTLTNFEEIRADFGDFVGERLARESPPLQLLSGLGKRAGESREAFTQCRDTFRQVISVGSHGLNRF